MTSLNPVMTIGEQIAEPLRLHQKLDRRAAAGRAVEMLKMVDIPVPERRVDEYPRLLIADEPTTALDVTIQAQILELMQDLKRRTGAAVLLITHDLAVVRDVAHRVMVMYAGRKVEEAGVADLMARPRHPYTRGLLDAMPRGRPANGDGRLAEIPGTVPSLKMRVPGCFFADRCTRAQALCRSTAPALEAKAEAHMVACHFPLSY